MKKNNIILIGMPASGKSTIGKALAKRIGWKFVDGDTLIEQSYGKKLKNIIKEVGNNQFLEIENKINSSIEGQNQVIAPGGSVIFCKDAMKHFSEIGIIIYLKTSYYVLNTRLKDPVSRGVVLEKGETIKDIFHKRRPYFEKYADVVHKVQNIRIEKSIDKLLDRLSKYNL